MSHSEKFQDGSVSVSVLLAKKKKRKHSDEQPLEHNYFKLQSTYIGQCEFPGYKKMRKYDSTCGM